MQAEEFIDAISFFGEPNIMPDENGNKINSIYVQELQQFEGTILRLAFELMIKKYKYHKYPLLSECVDFCEEVSSTKRRNLTSEQASALDVMKQIRLRRQANA